MRTHSLRSLNIFEGVRWYPSSGSLMPGRVAQSVGHLTRKSQGLGSIPGLATYFRFFFRSRGAVVSYWRKYVHEVLVNHLEGLSLPRKSVVRLTDRPAMTLDVYRGRKTTTQQQLVVWVNLAQVSGIWINKPFRLTLVTWYGGYGHILERHMQVIWHPCCSCIDLLTAQLNLGQATLLRTQVFAIFTEGRQHQCLVVWLDSMKVFCWW